MRILLLLLAPLLLLGCTAERAATGNETNCTNCTNTAAPEPNATNASLNITVTRPNCTDSDDMDIYERGNVSLGAAAYKDACTDGSHVKEYYCEGSMATFETVECPPGSACADGACMLVGVNCTETDGGDDIYYEGTLTLVKGLTSAQYLDKCLDDKRVKEYYCTRDWYVEEIVNCPDDTVCIQAACKTEVCMDGDEGDDIYVKSVTSKGNDNEQDRCLDRASGTEYYCENNAIAAKNFTCPSRYRCDDGRCVKSTTHG